MKTRTLLLLALGCGLAIMLAGAVLLFQLATSDDVAEPIPLGTATRVGDVTISVDAVTERDGVLTVSAAVSAPAGTDPSTGFRLIASGRGLNPERVECSTECTVTFDTSDADGDARVLLYGRGDDQARWVLGK